MIKEDINNIDDDLEDDDLLKEIKMIIKEELNENNADDDDHLMKEIVEIIKEKENGDDDDDDDEIFIEIKKFIKDMQNDDLYAEENNATINSTIPKHNQEL